MKNKKMFITLFIILVSNFTFGWRARSPWCWSGRIIWDHDATTKISTISFPIGSIWRQEILDSLAQWNNMRGMAFEFDPITNDTNGTYRLGNGDNEIVFTDNSGAGGNLGVTSLRFGICWFGQEIREADIQFNNEIIWEIADHDPRLRETTANFRFTAVHEMGHFLGLLHEDNRMAVMQSTASGFFGGSAYTRVHPFPDDCVGSRTLYPHGNREMDIAISNFRWVSSNNTGLILPAGTITVRRGDTFTTGFAFGNLGNEHAEFDWIIVLSTNEIISTYDRTVLSGSGWGTPGYYGDFTFTARIPSDMPVGLYHAGGILDPYNNLPEGREGNNWVVFPGPILVIP
ncbi:MAG: matrixin family metalloprotease [Chrysiogenia bacterium]